VTTGDPAQERPLTLIDTHCHLDDASFADDLPTVIERSRAAGGIAWVNVGYAPCRWDASIGLSRRIPGMAHMLGVHPSHAQAWNDRVAECLAERLVASGACAVGEIGLDFYRDNASLDVQRRALIDQLAIARDLGLPAVLHLRDAEDEILEILAGEASLPPLVFHSFDGSERLTRAAVEQVDLEAGIVGDRDRARGIGDGARLKDRVFDERRAGLLRKLHAQLRRGANRDSWPEERPQFGELALVPGGDHYGPPSDGSGRGRSVHDGSRLPKQRSALRVVWWAIVPIDWPRCDARKAATVSTCAGVLRRSFWRAGTRYGESVSSTIRSSGMWVS